MAHSRFFYSKHQYSITQLFTRVRQNSKSSLLVPMQLRFKLQIKGKEPHAMLRLTFVRASTGGSPVQFPTPLSPHAV